jgi:hypothetical protein
MVGTGFRVRVMVELGCGLEARVRVVVEARVRFTHYVRSIVLLCCAQMFASSRYSIYV